MRWQCHTEQPGSKCKPDNGHKNKQSSEPRRQNIFHKHHNRINWGEPLWNGDRFMLFVHAWLFSFENCFPQLSFCPTSRFNRFSAANIAIFIFTPHVLSCFTFSISIIFVCAIFVQIIVLFDISILVITSFLCAHLRTHLLWKKDLSPTLYYKTMIFFFAERVLRQPTVHVALFYLHLNSKLHVNIYFLDG